MIKIENIINFGWESAIRGMRNPMNSWDKSDSEMGCPEIHREADYCFQPLIGDNDLKLMQSLVKAGTDHSKFMRMIIVTCDITAPLYWWKEFDTYKVGTVRNSCSTMHKIHSKEFTLDDFSHDHLETEGNCHLKLSIADYDVLIHSYSLLEITVGLLNSCRNLYLQTKDKKYWYNMIQLLPSSYNQRATVQLNYAVLRNMYHSRKNHKLDEWRDFCAWVETLPYSKELICIE